jgi:hypothetical protein
MTIGPEHEDPRPPEGEAFSDAVTFSFGDAAADVYAVARVGLSGERSASGLGLVFHGNEPVAVQADGGVEAAERAWGSIDAAGLATTVERPLEAWTLSFASDGATFDLQAEALSAPGSTAEGGMDGYEQLCRFTGTATIAGERVAIDCLGQRGHSWGAPDWSKIALTRTVTAWMDTETAVSVSAVRPASARHHADEAVAATLVTSGTAVPVAEPLMSTTYDGDGRQRHAGLELWVDEDGFPYRAAGEVLCGTTLDLGRLRLDAAFFAWRGEGRTGVGRYDVLRRTDDA